jgi:hypothetical protein
MQKIAERRSPDIAFYDIESLISAPTKSAVDRTETHTPKGSYLGVDTTNGEEEIFDEEHTWMDEVVMSIEAQDPAFEIESQVDSLANSNASIIR